MFGSALLCASARVLLGSGGLLGPSGAVPCRTMVRTSPPPALARRPLGGRPRRGLNAPTMNPAHPP
eukprot:1346855-Alexandrium_andersonii.AAC.1